MKRITALILIVCMALCLTGCSYFREELAVREAKGLIKDGEYQQAMELLRSIENYQQITALLEEAQTLMDEEDRQLRVQDAQPYLGMWLSIDDFDTSLTLREDGTCLFIREGEEAVFDYRCTGNTIEVFSLDNFKVTTANGLTWITAQNFGREGANPEGSRFVREADYPAMGPQAIAITTDNWQDYFELRQERFITYDDLGQPEYIGFGYGIYLKQEFADRLYDSPEALRLTFRLEYDRSYRYVKDPAGDYTIGAVTNYQDRGRVDSTAKVVDNRVYTHPDLIGGHVGAGFWGMMPASGSTFLIYENAAVTDVQGTITLYP